MKNHGLTSVSEFLDDRVVYRFEPLPVFTRQPGIQQLKLPATFRQPDDDPIIRVIDLMHLRNTRYVVVCNDHGVAIALTGQRSICELVTESFPRGVLTNRIDATPDFKQREGA